MKDRSAAANERVRPPADKQSVKKILDLLEVAPPKEEVLTRRG